VISGLSNAIPEVENHLKEDKKSEFAYASVASKKVWLYSPLRVPLRLNDLIGKSDRIDSSASIPAQREMPVSPDITPVVKDNDSKDKTIDQGDPTTENQSSGESALPASLSITDGMDYPVNNALAKSIVSVNLNAVPLDERAESEQNERDNSRALMSSKSLQFSSPLAGPLRITSHVGMRLHPVTDKMAYHSGTDFSAPRGSQVFSVESGIVTDVGYNGLAGNYITIRHGNGWSSRYLHLDSTDIQVNQRVRQGRVIAHSGATGRVTGPHLHFELIHQGKVINSDQLLYRSAGTALAVTTHDQVEEKPVVEDPTPRIIFITELEGETQIVVKNAGQMVYAQLGDKVNGYKVVRAGKRFALQPE
jgi:murein DD-endopeptidase MepM/ murein hydrolase activator NlpD